MNIDAELTIVLNVHIKRIIAVSPYLKQTRHILIISRVASYVGKSYAFLTNNREINAYHTHTQIPKYQQPLEHEIQ